jgi:hypothetical protein
MSLGPEVSEHAGSIQTVLAGIVVLGLLGAGGAVWVFQGITRYGEGPDAADHSVANFVLILGSTLLLTVAYFGFHIWVGLRHRVVLYRDGFVSIYPGLEQVFRWEEIVSVRQRSAGYDLNFIPVGSFSTFHVRRKDETEVELNNYLSAVARLGKAVLQNTFNHLYAPRWDAYKRGMIVSFGITALSGKGIHVRRALWPWEALLPWDRFHSLEVTDKHLHIKRARFFTWRKVPMLKVENYHVLQKMVTRIQNEAGR